MRLSMWRTQLDKRRAKHEQAMADSRIEYRKLCELADFPGDVSDWEYRGRVFDVQDIGARKALIAHNIKLRELMLSEAYLDVDLWQYRVAEAKTKADNWWMWPSFQTLVLCLASSELERVKISPTVGAIAVAACGIMIGLSYRDIYMRNMREAVKHARSELLEAKNWLEKRQRAEPRFSEVEAETGQAQVG